MDYFFKQLKRLREGTLLEASKKDAIRSELVSYMRATRHINGERSAILTNVQIKMRLIRFAVPAAILVLLSGGTSFAAASALPGDALYPIKVGVNEKVEGSFKFSAEQKAAFEARLAEKRLAEASQLAAKGRLNAEASAQVQASFEKFADRVEARVEALRASGNEEAAAEVSARFETALEAHARALAAMKARLDANATSSAGSANSGRGNAEEILKVSLPVKAALKAVQKIRLDAEAKGGASVYTRAETSADLRIEAAGEAIESAREEVDNKSAKVGAAVAAKADAELDAADNLVVQAEAKADAGIYVEAVRLANRAVQMAQQVKLLLNLQIQVGIIDDERVESDGLVKFDLFDDSGQAFDGGPESEDDGENRGSGSDAGDDGIDSRSDSDDSGVLINL